MSLVITIFVILGALVAMYYAVTWIEGAKEERARERERLQKEAIERLENGQIRSPECQEYKKFKVLLENKEKLEAKMANHWEEYGILSIFSFIYNLPYMISQEHERRTIPFDVLLAEKMARDAERVWLNVEIQKQKEIHRLNKGNHYRSIMPKPNRLAVHEKFHRCYIPCANFRNAAKVLKSIIEEIPDAEIVEHAEDTLINRFSKGRKVAPRSY